YLRELLPRGCAADDLQARGVPLDQAIAVRFAVHAEADLAVADSQLAQLESRAPRRECRIDIDPGGGHIRLEPEDDADHLQHAARGPRLRHVGSSIWNRHREFAPG